MYSIFFILIFSVLLAFELGISIFLNKIPNENIFVFLILIFFGIFFKYLKKDIKKMKELSIGLNNIIKKKKKITFVIDTLIAYSFGFLLFFIVSGIFLLLMKNMPGVRISLYIMISLLVFISFFSIISSLFKKN